MKKTIVLALTGVLLIGVSGCGSSPAKEQVAALNEMTSILEGIKDDNSAQQALPKLEKAADKAREAGEQIASGKMSEAELKPYAKDIVEAYSNMLKAASKAGKAAKSKAMPIVMAVTKAQPNGVKKH